MLKHNRYFVESSHPETLQKLLRHSTIASARVINNTDGSSLLLKDKAPSSKDLMIGGQNQPISTGTNGERVAQEINNIKPEDELFHTVVELDNGKRFAFVLH